MGTRGLSAYLAFSLCLVFVQLIGLSRSDMKTNEKSQLRDKTVKMFYHAYDSYMKYAYPADELMPLSCRGRYRGSEPDRGDIDETLGNFSLTLIDTLDTLAVLGDVKEFERAVKLVIKDVTFDTDVIVSVFETNIRILGGLLGGHVVSVTLKNDNKGMSWYDGELLNMAIDIADRLLVAFNTSTGIPYSRVNLLYGINHPMSRIVNEKDTCTACGGTMIMEFAALSRLTGNSIYEDKARKAMDSIWHYRSRSSDLVGTVIDVHNGDWIRRDSGIGAGIDSYYEYCLKAYILLGDTSYLEKFNKHYAAINKYIRQGVMMLDVLMHQPDRPIRSFVDSLQAFWPGLQVLMGDLKPAIETHEMLYEVAKRHKFIPEAFTTNFDLYWSQHPLRPEFAESTYFLYEATKDPYYLEVGKHIVETLEEHAKVECGFAAIKDLRTFTHEDKMDSFVLAETFKYLYLLFSEESERILDIHNFVFTTEAHLLPLSLGNVKLNENGERILKNMTEPRELFKPKRDTQQSTCPNDAKDKFSMMEFARIVRKGYRQPKPAVPMCTPASSEAKQHDSPLHIDRSRTPKLLAEHFQIGNTEHLQLLKEMGINVVQSNDGKVQLVHQAGTASTSQDAADGIRFMQDMIQISKAKGDQASGLKPRMVQLMSAPFNGELYFGAGAAQFGLDVSNHAGVSGEVVEAIPYNACSDLFNKEHMDNRIIIAERGGCMFIDKVRRAQSCGAIGVIIIDNIAQSSEGQSMFAMSGDSHSEDVKIPSVFLFKKEGDTLRNHAKDSINDHGIRLRVRLAGADKPKDAESTGKARKEEPSEQANEAVEERTFLDSPKQEKSTDSEERDPRTPEVSPEEVDHKQKKTEDENVLDKMEASMENKPSVFTFENEPSESTKTESHVGRSEDGKLVNYETTYSQVSEQGASHIRITTKMVPFETEAAEINKSNLDHESGVAEEAMDAASDEVVIGEDTGGVQKMRFKGSGKPEELRLKNGDQIDDFGRSIAEVSGEAENGGNCEAVKMEQSIETEKGNGLEDVSKEERIDEQAEKGETGGVVEVGSELFESLGSEKLHQGNDKQEEHTFAEVGGPFGTSEGQVDDGSLNRENEGEVSEEVTTTKRKNVLCNAAGCFSSIEELDMFNELALQVKSNLEDLDEIENAMKDQLNEPQKSMDESLALNGNVNSNRQDHESKPNDR